MTLLVKIVLLAIFAAAIIISAAPNPSGQPPIQPSGQPVGQPTGQPTDVPTQSSSPSGQPLTNSADILSLQSLYNSTLGSSRVGQLFARDAIKLQHAIMESLKLP